MDHLVNENKTLAPWDRPPYHAHVVGTSTVYTSLDSGYGNFCIVWVHVLRIFPAVGHTRVV